MKAKKTTALLLSFVFFLLTLVSCGGGTQTPADSTTAADLDTTASAPETEPADQYSAPEKEAEVYDPSGDNKDFKLLGAAHSDGEYAVVYGNCATGAKITANIGGEDVSVQSFGGCFAIRAKMTGRNVVGTISQSYNGEAIGEPIEMNDRVIEPEWSDDPTWSAMIGGDNQAFYKRMMNDIGGKNLLDESAIESAKKKYAKRVKVSGTLSENGCEIICLLIPDVVTVYPEIVPEEYEKTSGETRMDQVVALLREAGVTVLDERETFKAHRDDSLPLYYKYDSHWTDYGAYLAYVDLFNYISEKFPAAAPRKFDEFEWNYGNYTGGDMTYYFDVDQGGKVYEWTFVRTMRFSDDIPEDIKNIVRYKNPKSLAYLSYTDEVQNNVTYDTGRTDLPSIYAFRDSYGTAIFDIMAERCNRIQFYPMFTYTWNVSKIEEFAPDYVVYLCTEWELENILDN